MRTDAAQLLAGLAFLGGGTITLLGFVTAAALYPGYDTTTQTISALGATSAPSPSQLVFNGTMVLAGLLTLVAAFGLHVVYRRRLLTAVITVTAVGGYVGVGLFPAQTGLPHLVAAVIAFGGIGLGALVVAATVEGPYRYVSVGLGVAELITFLLFMTLQGSTPLGIGGLERWVAYLGLLWATSFGGTLLAGTN